MNRAQSTMVPSMHNRCSIGLIDHAHIYSVNRCRACIPCCTVYLHLHTFPHLLPLLSRAFPLCVFLTSYIQVGSNLSASRLGCLQPCPQTPTPMLTPRPCRAWVKACLTSQRRDAPTWIGMVRGQKCIAAALCCACDQCLPLLHQRAQGTRPASLDPPPAVPQCMLVRVAGFFALGQALSMVKLLPCPAYQCSHYPCVSRGGRGNAALSGSLWQPVFCTRLG